ncbi:MAG: conserved membrane protein of unknown function [Promethearchaeota archaeon]|nr:MAG: conserved membrane protein of unknown function [Candidatus Lokiarchaeota archaeon]
MSKFKRKKAPKKKEGISEKQIVFERSLQISGWFFLITLGIFMLIYALFDMLLEIVQIEVNAVVFAFVIFMATSAAFSFGLVSSIRKNRENTSKIFYDWLIGEFLFCMFVIFAVAIYQF